MVVSCEIDFKDNPFGVFYAGQVIFGSVVLNADKEKLVKAIILKIKGFASTCWSEDESDLDNKTTEEIYSGHEDYIRSKVELLAAEGKNVALEPGSRVYKFACQIPTVCPSSFEGTHGRVRYMVNVKLIRPWKFDQTFSRSFTVLKVMDLNREGLFLSTPALSEDQKTYNCWPCRSEPIRLQLSLPQRGFVPGQKIPVGVLVTNDSHIRVEEIEASLVMMVLYYSQHSVKTISERFVVSKQQGEGVTRNCKKQFTFDLLVPATPPTCFDLCRIIQIAYQVAVETKVKSWHINERVHMPVTIGNVPLTRQLTQQPRPIPVEVEVVAQQLDEKALVLVDDVSAAAPAAAVNPWAADATIAPPSYAEALHIREGPIKSSKPATSRKSKHTEFSPSTTHTKENCAFTPLYAVFHINNLAETKQGDRAEDIDRSTWF
ncbi:arrestin domain-containing protein 3-like [Drosophila novamexicana]|uniref:arrestin domain-containing protein 3-like n=1 Tax=Drosophila novamexicana TaxID=47314 RepID=UPI0011E5F611|nr:arrestin domain-containing protein 3-like [Drosophila novamexicana]